LIRRGYAQLIDSADDLIRAMGWKTKQEKLGGVQTSLIGLMDNLSETQQLLLTKLETAEEGLHINVLVQETGKDYGEVSSELTMLELDGLVRSLPGGIYRFVR
jgi:DNA processing protein